MGQNFSLCVSIEDVCCPQGSWCLFRGESTGHRVCQLIPASTLASPASVCVCQCVCLGKTTFEGDSKMSPALSNPLHFLHLRFLQIYLKLTLLYLLFANLLSSFLLNWHSFVLAEIFLSAFRKFSLVYHLNHNIKCINKNHTAIIKLL